MSPAFQLAQQTITAAFKRAREAARAVPVQQFPDKNPVAGQQAPGLDRACADFRAGSGDGGRAVQRT